MMKLVLTLLLALCASHAAAQADFGLDPLSPEVPGRSPSDILDPTGTTVVVSAATLGLPTGANVDAFSYGVDQIEPLGPNFYVTILYSVNRLTKGLQASPVPYTGAVWREAQGNGAAGDIFYLKARLGPPGTGMVVITRGLRSDATNQNLTPKNVGPRESDLDGLSFRVGEKPKTVYFSVDPNGVPGATWGPADILRVDINPTTGVATPPQVWATAAALGLRPTDNIDALAIQNRGGNALTSDDVVYVSLSTQSPTRATLTQGREAVLQVFPGAPAVVFNARILNLANAPTEELDGLTGVDPGPRERDEQKPPRK